MIRRFTFAAVAALLFVGCTPHFINDQEYRGKVEQDFAKRESIMRASGIELEAMNLQQDEMEAMMFLYAYMPLGDIVNKEPSYYLQHYHLTEEALKDGWFATGDYGTLDPEGRLKITGRKKNMIVLTNGKNIYPEELEEQIGNLDYVKEVVVYAIKDENDQEDALQAEVFLDEDLVKAMNEENIEARLMKDINEIFKEYPRYKQIAKVKLSDKEFVKNSSNKIKRNLIGKE